jgi:hypothetical protein
LGTLQVLERYRGGLTRQLDYAGSGVVEAVDLSTPWGFRLVVQAGTWVDGLCQGAASSAGSALCTAWSIAAAGRPASRSCTSDPLHAFSGCICGVRARPLALPVPQ